MSALQTLKPRSAERRRHQRVQVQLLGRFMLENRREYPCQTVDISPGGIMLRAPVHPSIGERVIAYVDQLGRIEGRVVRHLPNGFAMSMAATIRKRDKLAAQLTWLANKSVLGLPEDRRHDRVQPRNPRTVITLEDGRQVVARLIDVSSSGAGVSTEMKLPLGTKVQLGRTPARVVRLFEGGVALEFFRPLSAAEIDVDVSVSL
jgi:PilZ domain